MPTCGIAKEVALESSNNGEVEGRVLLANCVDKDYIAVDAGGSGIVVELFVDCVTG